MRNKNNVRKNVNTYQEWLEKNEGYDPHSSDNLSDSSIPYSNRTLPPILDDAYEKLEELYYGGQLKGRQKQLVGLLFHGFVRPTRGQRSLGIQETLAKQLNMKQSNVVVELRKIMKKIYKSII